MTAATIDEYLAALPLDRRATVEDLRRTIRAAAPEATETIAYQMPALRSHGGQFIDALGDELQPYLAGKGTIQFRADQPIPTGLVTRIVKVRLAENAASEAR
jgi:uncharacterized protein YdhG (YjbR/CyaY superfamily)